jgi:L-seryl-tRNA(Ser) seleniumtransferase
MVEIGDGFRIPELLESMGARLREVGTTNRVRLDDYAAVVGQATAFVLKVHASNFRVEGFTSAVSVKELTRLGVPVVADIGSGLLRPHPRLPNEPDAATALRDGADLVTASGDKLLGGPQCGLVLGRTDLVERLRRFPFARALRVDKLTLAALEATLALYRDPARALAEIPTLALLGTSAEELRSRAAALRRNLIAEGIACDVVETVGSVGAGAFPDAELPGAAVALAGDAEVWARRLRAGKLAIIGRVHDGRLHLDLRAVLPREVPELALAVIAARE